MYRVGDAVRIKRNHRLANMCGRVLAAHGDEYYISLAGNRGLYAGAITLTEDYLETPAPYDGRVRCVACRKWFNQWEPRKLGTQRFCTTCYRHVAISPGGRKGG